MNQINFAILLICLFEYHEQRWFSYNTRRALDHFIANHRAHSAPTWLDSAAKWQKFADAEAELLSKLQKSQMNEWKHECHSVEEEGGEDDDAGIHTSILLLFQTYL